MPTPLARKRIALLLLCAVVFLDSMDLSLMAVALPAIGGDLHLSASTLQWLLSGYSIAYGGFLLLGGRLADLLGRRRIFLLALAVFAAAGLAGGLLSTGWLLILTRVVKGLAAALTAPAALSLITTTFTEGSERNRALGAYALAGATGYSAGLVSSGLLAEVDWRLVFFLPVPIAAAVLIAAPSVLPKDLPVRGPRRFDAAGAVTATGGVLLLVYALSESNPFAGAGVAVLLAAFVVVERRVEHPLVPLDVFRSRDLSSANLAAVAWACATIGWQFAAVLYLQQVRGYGELATGLGIVPMGLAIVVAARVSGRLIPRWGLHRTAAAGLLAQGAGILLFLRAGGDAGYVTVLLPALVVHGVGNGLSFPSLNVGALSGQPDERQGLASGLITSAVQIGGGLGVALLSALLRSGGGSGNGSGSAAGGGGLGGSTSGYHTAFLTAAAFSLVGALTAAFGLRPRGAAGTPPVSAADAPEGPAAEPVATPATSEETAR